MRTVVLDPAPIELEELIDRRRRLGLDLYDEVWEGEYHMVPGPGGPHGDVDQQLAELLGPLARKAGLVVSGPFNLGSEDDFRVPDRGVLRARPTGVWVPTAAIVVEIVSAGDETWDKLDFYARCEVDEFLVIEPVKRSINWLGLAAGEYRELDRSALLGLTVAELAGAMDWPQA